MAYIPGRIPASNLVQIPGRIPANLNISLQIPQGVHTDSCRNLYKKNQSVNMIPARNLVSFPVVILLCSCWTISYRQEPLINAHFENVGKNPIFLNF